MDNFLSARFVVQSVGKVSARSVNGIGAHKLLMLTEDGYELPANLLHRGNKDAEHLSILEEGKVKITVQNSGL